MYNFTMGGLKNIGIGHVNSLRYEKMFVVMVTVARDSL